MARRRYGCWMGFVLVLAVGCDKRDPVVEVVPSTSSKAPKAGGADTTPGKDTKTGGPTSTSAKDSGKSTEVNKPQMIGKPRFTISPTRTIRDLALSPSGALMSWAEDEKIRVWDVQANKSKAEQPVDSLWDVVVFSPDGKTVALGSGGGPIKLLDVQTLEARTFQGHNEGIHGLAFVSGNRLVSGCFDRTVKIWDLGTGKDVKTITVPNRVLQMGCSADGRLAILKLYSTDQPKLWDLTTGKESPSKLPAATSETNAALSPDGKTLALSEAAGKILLWDVEGGAARKTLTGEKSIYNMCFSADSKTLAWVDYGAVRVCDVATGEMRAIYPTIANRVAMSADGKVLASTGGSGISVWDVPAAK